MQAPIRTPMFDKQGNLNRVWALFFLALGNPFAVSPMGITGNLFTPNLGLSDFQYGLVTQDSFVAAPINAQPDTDWTLILDQDAVGGHNVTFDPSYYFKANLLGLATASTRAQSQWLFDANGNNSLSGTPSTDQPVPPAVL